MTIELRPEHLAWLNTQVAAGLFTSEQAAFDAMFPAKDDVWAKIYIDEAIADIEAGNVTAWDATTLRAQLHTHYPELNSDQN